MLDSEEKMLWREVPTRGLQQSASEDTLQSARATDQGPRRLDDTSPMNATARVFNMMSMYESDDCSVRRTNLGA